MKQPHIITLIGKPSSGKNLLVTEIAERIHTELQEEVFVNDTGAQFRNSYNKTNLSAPMNDFHIELFKKIQAEGNLQDPRVSAYMVIANLLHNYSGQSYIILNGSPRSSDEFSELIPFITNTYHPQKTLYVYIDVTEENILQRMKDRHDEYPREDTSTIEKRKNRLKEFTEKTLPMIPLLETFYRDDFITLDNNGTLEELKQQIYAIEL